MTYNLTCFGPVEWYAALLRDPDARLSLSEPWRKQTVRSRYNIMTANGVQTLSVPVSVQQTDHKPTISDISISDHGNWRHLHWQALATAYGMSPFFDYYADELLPLFQPGSTSLADYDVLTLRTMLRLMDIDRDVPLVAEPVTMPVEHMKPLSTPYYQTFQRRHGFQPGMSVLDLLFNMGPEGVRVLS